MAVNRYVQPSAHGGWDILKEGHRRPLVHCETEDKAVEHALELTRLEGGGEIRVMNMMGKIVRETIVTPS